MVRDVLADEAGDEVVAVVIAGTQLERERVAGPGAGLAQPLGRKLFEELVVQPLVHQDRQAFGRRCDQLDGIVRLPGLGVRAQVGAERLLSPGYARWRDDGRECRYAAIAPGLAKGDGQRAVPAHGM